MCFAMRVDIQDPAISKLSLLYGEQKGHPEYKDYTARPQRWLGLSVGKVCRYC